jgi:hypothetical protein
MVGTVADEIMGLIARYGRFLAAGKITTDEFAASILDHLAGAPGSNTHIAADVVNALPAEVLPAMAAIVRDALVPGFRKSGWAYGGPSLHTEAEQAAMEAAESAFRTERVRSWALALDGPLAEQIRFRAG